MAEQTTLERVRPEPIKAVPVRHPGRWVAVGVLAGLAAMFVHFLVTNDHFHRSYMVDNMFRPPTIAAARGTILLTISSMIIAAVMGIGLAAMRLSPTPLRSPLPRASTRS